MLILAVVSGALFLLSFWDGANRWNAAGLFAGVLLGVASTMLGMLQTFVDRSEPTLSPPVSSATGRPAPAVLRQVGRLGGVYRKPVFVKPQRLAGRHLPEPIRAFLYDIRWPDARFRGGDLMRDISQLKFMPTPLSKAEEFGAAMLGEGGAWLVIRLDSPEPSDPLVFIREGQEDREQVPLSTLLALLVPDEREVSSGSRG
ncbi:hypothetical protein [Hyalangium versicolor]|uniref:hypothetical protein n=1 Tax=Hyalangium versicolor TaxID=2861190 RepID=UPI001CCCF17C|nr:hypothetical protein [Hyalangium versicolor]